MGNIRDKHYSAAELNKLLPIEVSKLYKAVNLGKRSSTRFEDTKFGLIDFKTISIERIKQLIKLKCPYFVPKK